MIGFINNLDKKIIFFINDNFHFPILDKLMIFTTALGDKGLIWIIIALMLLLNKKTRYIGVITIASLILSTVLGEGIIKHLLQRQRPYVDFPWVRLMVDKSTIYSFPSGHTTSSFAAAYVLSKYLKKYSPVFWILACMIAFSRVYLFMHYPTDVMAGVILGLICGKVTTYFYMNLRCLST